MPVRRTVHAAGGQQCRHSTRDPYCSNAAARSAWFWKAPVTAGAGSAVNDPVDIHGVVYTPNPERNTDASDNLNHDP